MNSRNEITWKVTERAWKDEEFRKALKSDARAAIENELGLTLPKGIEVEVLEEGRGKMYLVVPANPNASSDELSSEELDQVAGGIRRGPLQDPAPLPGCNPGDATIIDATVIDGCVTWQCTVTPTSDGCSDC